MNSSEYPVLHKNLPSKRVTAKVTKVYESVRNCKTHQNVGEGRFGALKYLNECEQCSRKFYETTAQLGVVSPRGHWMIHLSFQN